MCSQPVAVICTYTSGVSDFACGGHAVFVDKEEIDLFYKAFSSLESNLDSNSRDLLAISYALKLFYKSVIKRKLVKLFTRSRNAAVISSKDSTSLRLRLKLNGSPGLSMCTLTSSVVSSILTIETFLQLVSNSSHLFSVLFTVSRFASPASAKCARFYSKFGAPVRRKSKLLLFRGRMRIIRCFLPSSLLRARFFIWNCPGLGAFCLSLSGRQHHSGPCFFHWVVQEG